MNMPAQLIPYTPRSNETTSRQFVRDGRFFHSNEHWYFKTREGVNYGPYESRTECKYAYAEFIEVVSDQNQLCGSSLDFQDVNKEWKMPKIEFL
jgi:hypothetical protein